VTAEVGAQVVLLITILVRIRHLFHKNNLQVNMTANTAMFISRKIMTYFVLLILFAIKETHSNLRMGELGLGLGLELGLRFYNNCSFSRSRLTSSNVGNVTSYSGMVENVGVTVENFAICHFIQQTLYFRVHILC